MPFLTACSDPHLLHFGIALPSHHKMRRISYYLYLYKHSPKIKAILRKLKVRAKELLDQAIAQAFSAVTLSDISGWFRHDGYALR
jgi:hypothetical protein